MKFYGLAILIPCLAMAAGSPCPHGSHWDEPMQMCMPDEPASSACHNAEPDADEPPKPCPSTHSKTELSFHFNQFLVGSETSGPRGRDAVYSSNMWMLSLSHELSPKNKLAVTWMGTAEKWTVPAQGIPEVLQVGEANLSGVPYLDAQHPHSSPIMGLTFEDILKLDENGEKKLTFFFAPRGEATSGPDSFMHRLSADGNPNVPLAHHLQDFTHISSTVAGTRLEVKQTEIETSVFSGREPSPARVDLDMHQPDSYAVRVKQHLSPALTVGASYGDVNDSGDHKRVTSGWVGTQQAVQGGRLDTSTIWGRVAEQQEGQTLNSFLEEFVYRLGQNAFFGRVEVLQRTPEQLQIIVTDGDTNSQWVRAITLGYERSVYRLGDLNLRAGTSYTKSILPDEFKPAYGGHPNSLEIHLRLGWMKSKRFK
jgi:hypothetical protein